MSDAIVSAVAERLVAILQEQIQYEVNLVSGVEKEVQDLSDKLKTLRNVLDDAENRGFKEKSVRSWLKKLEDTAYEMDDILDEWNYAILKHKMGDAAAVTSSEQKVCCSFIPSSPCLCFKKVVVRRDIAKKIENVKAKLDEILREKDDFNFVMSLPPTDPVPKPLRLQSTSSIEVENVHGVDIKRNKNDIVMKLMLDSPALLSIVGMGGIGKTTLAQLVYNHTQVEDCFQLRIWISVSNPFDVAGVARWIVDDVGTQIIPQGTNQLELILKKLRDSISGKKFLLVLDDVWTEIYEEWEPLKINLGHGAKGSKILVTTRNERVANMMGTLECDIYRPQLLTDKECWTVLRRKSLSGRREETWGEFEDVGKKIASKCKGLPLAANVLGSLLQFKNSLEEWENVWKSEIWQLEEAEVQLFPHLLLSYNALSPPLKLCFSYCAVYPEDSLINTERLIEEWRALGYLGSVRGNGGVEVKGRNYFNNLAMLSLFRDLVRNDEQIVSCKMHDVVHYFAQFLRKKDDRAEAPEMMTKGSCQVCNPTLVSQAQEYRSLVWGWDSPTSVCECLTSVRVLRFKWKRSVIPRGMEKLIHLRRLELNGNILSKDALKIICRLYLLQTLLLASCCLKEIPKEIKNLVHLRQLQLSSNNGLKELPESMCSLGELQILNVEHCTSLHGLPEGMHRLQNLQRLLIQNSPASRRFPRGLGELSGLRTLRTTGFHGGIGGSKLGLLKKLNSLSGSLKMEIKYNSDLRRELVEDAREAELKNKIHIHTLEIHFVNEHSSFSSPSSSWMDIIEAPEPYLPKQRKLVIQGYRGPGLPHWISSPLNSVKEIELLGFSDLAPYKRRRNGQGFAPLQ